MSTTKEKESWKNLLILFALLICSCLLPSPSSVVAKGSTPNVGGPGEYAHKLRTYEEFVRQEMERERIPGITIGFVKDGDIWVKGFGYADLENRVPAKADSSYRLASLTKSMTAVAVLQLAEKGKIILDAEVQTYVPYFPKKKWPVTVRQLLFHLGGLRHNIEGEKVLTGHLTTKEAVAQYADSDLVAEPGTKFSYSSPGYVLLGAVIESASTQSYEDYMRQNIWVPLGMNNTRLGQRSNPKRLEPYHASGAITFFADYVAMYKSDPDYPGKLRFSGAFVDQIAKWNQAWSKTNNSYVRRLWITPSSDLGEIAETLRKSFLGADVYPYLNRNISTPTWQLILKGDREQAAQLGQLAVDLYPQSDLSYVLLAVVKIMFRQKESARTLLKKAAEINGSDAAFSRALSSYAYILSNAGRVDDGLELLLLTVESYPMEANLYDSIGEFYLKTGNKVKAIESYKKALQLDSNLESSKRMLEKLTRVH